MKVPECLNNELYAEIIRDGFNFESDFKIVHSKLEIVTAPGDNYSGTVYRIFLDIIKDKSRVKIQFIMKHLLNSEWGESCLVKYMNAFEKEIDMMKNIMPRLTKIANVPQFSPRFHHSLSLPEARLIVMQDLNELPYRMCERQEALDFDHCCIVLTKLGQMHASSMILARDHPSLMDKYSFGIYRGSMENPGLMRGVLPANIATLCQVSKEWEGFQDISQKLYKMKEKYWKFFYDSTWRKCDGYQVLNHGDFWTNNFFFKYDENSGKPIDILFIDFQYSYYASPANDLQYFINTSPQNNIREDHREDLLLVYYSSFEKKLNELNYKNIPSFDQLLEEMKKWEMYGFMTATHILPIVLMEEQCDQGSGTEGLMDPVIGQKMTEIMIKGKRFAEAIKPILRRCDQLKLFDDFDDDFLSTTN